jgi:hypothetical protein
MAGQTDSETLRSIADTDLQRTYMWVVALPPLPVEGGDVRLANSVSDLCQSVVFNGGVKHEVKQMKVGVYTLASQSKQTVAAPSMTFLAPAQDIVYSYFRKWLGLSVSLKGAYRPKSEYAFAFDIVQMGVDGTVLDKGRLFGAFPTSMSKGDLSYEGSGKIQTWAIWFSVDRVDWGNG